MNAAPADQIRLLDVQDLDVRLTQLDHRRTTLPEHAEIRALESEIGQQRDLLVAAQTEESDTAREQTKAEQDVEQVRTRAARNQRRLDSGEITSPKDLENLQSELVSLGRRQDDLETVVLEIMERNEAAAERAKELGAAVAGLEDKLTEAVGRRDAALREIDQEAEQVRGRRAEAAGGIPDPLLKLYDRLRRQYGGVGAARLHQKRCEGCRQELALTELNEVRQAPADAVLRCGNCSRILVRTPESGL
ncbi:zinc ribbon domain-containing protein [Streptomyces sp. YIM 98790]|uniref:zinc ribbon domain-containing protein n=1 Tax=Streptomyces sp. YIM 98790 TaxID=2689077 RepID=UPI001AA00174|nr:C4-type zinc ribbon domain-containing protein [Streptomyces sp. YIM 98790]